MFPFDIDEEENEEIEEMEEIPYREYEIDFVTGQLTGRIVEGREAVKVWIYLALHIDRYHFEQYTWNYGNELSELIGEQAEQEYVQLEAYRMIEECLLQNHYILGISGFECEIENDKLTGKVTVDTEYGEVEVDV